jgi:hypothetical protein
LASAADPDDESIGGTTSTGPGEFSAEFVCPLPTTALSSGLVRLRSDIVRACFGTGDPELLATAFFEAKIGGGSSDFELLDFELMIPSFFADFTSATGSFFDFSLGVGTRWPTGGMGTAGATGPGVAGEGFCWV